MRRENEAGEVAGKWLKRINSVRPQHQKMTKEKIIETAKKITGWMEDIELAALYDLSMEFINAGDYAFEVGSWKGKSSFVIASVCAEKNAQLFCIDTFTGTIKEEAHYHEASSIGARRFMKENIIKNLRGLPAKFICENSLTAHKLLQNNGFAFGFIDGDHTEPVVSQDLMNYFPKVKVGGVFACHDYNPCCPDVIKAVDQKFAGYGAPHIYRSIIAFKKK